MPGSGVGSVASGVVSPLTAFESPHYFSAVWIWDNSAGAWVDRTLEAASPAGTAFSIFADANDFVYLRSSSRFDLAAFLLENAGGTGALSYFYYDGTDVGTWTQFAPAYDYDFSVDGAEGFFNLINWAPKDFTSIWPHAATPPDNRAGYWIRIQSSVGAVSPTVLQIKKRPFAAYCTASDVSKLLQLKQDFSSVSTPSRETVEDYISAAQSHIDYKTQKSWRLNYKVNELYEFNIAGFRLLERDVQKITRLEVWNGGTWDTKREGRQYDYFLVPDMGMVYFSRYFMLPARLQSYNAPVWLWGWAEFHYPIRVTFLYGRDIHTDSEQGRIIWDLTRKLAAIDVLQNHDYSILVVAGTDRVSLERKIENWKQEVEDKLETLRGWIVG